MSEKGGGGLNELITVVLYSLFAYKKGRLSPAEAMDNVVSMANAAASGKRLAVGARSKFEHLRSRAEDRK